MILSNPSKPLKSTDITEPAELLPQGVVPAAFYSFNPPPFGGWGFFLTKYPTWHLFTSPMTTHHWFSYSIVQLLRTAIIKTYRGSWPDMIRWRTCCNELTITEGVGVLRRIMLGKLSPRKVRDVAAASPFARFWLARFESTRLIATAGEGAFQELISCSWLNI